jgi:hypothetical protein
VSIGGVVPIRFWDDALFIPGRGAGGNIITIPLRHISGDLTSARRKRNLSWLRSFLRTSAKTYAYPKERVFWVPSNHRRPLAFVVL